MSKQGWIKLHRRVLDHWVSTDPVAFFLWAQLLLMSNHDSAKFVIDGQLIECSRGSTVTSIRKLAEKAGVSRHKVSLILKMFEKEQMITQKTSHKMTYLTICNYDSYQGNEEETQPQNGHRTATSQPQRDTNKNDKNENNEKKILPPKVGKVKASPYREFKLEDFTWPPSWKSGGRKAVERWVAYKAQSGHPSILMSYQTAINKFAGDSKKFHDLVERAIANSWQGLNDQIPLGQQQTGLNFNKAPQSRPYIPPPPEKPIVRQPRPSAEELSSVRELIGKAFPGAYKEMEGERPTVETKSG